MEHSCTRCGAAVNNNSPFCPACEAPQIRFVPREPAQEEVRLHPATVPANPVVTPGPATEPYHAAATAGERRRWLRAAIYAGTIGSLLSIIPGGFVVGIPLSGVLAVRFYQNRRLQVQISRHLGFRLGALAGVFASAIFAVMTLLSFTNTAVWSEFTQELGERVHRAEVLNPDPQVRQLFEYCLTRQGMIAVIVVGMLFMCVVFVIVAGLSGMVSASVSNRRSTR